jgi:uncharacterized protein YjbI with pentapeptide repeats
MAKRTSPGPIGPPRIPAQLGHFAERSVRDNDVIEACEIGATTELESLIHALDIFESRLTGVRFTGADITESVLRDVEVVDAEWSGLRFNESRWSRVRVAGSRMSGFTAPALKMEDVVFDNCRLDGASFRSAAGERVAFVDCDLTDADFTQAKLATCVFVRCDLTRTDFTSSSLKQVSFDTSRLVDVRGVTSMSGITVNADHVLPLALAALATLRISVVDHDPLVEALLGPS